ncbi:MAG: GNAT family N-acetyltransferase, partial [Acidobacteriota bacterium]
MDPLLELIRSHTRRPPSRLLIIGRFREEQDEALLGAETTTRWDHLLADGEPGTELAPFDLAVWRLPSLWDDRLLERARDILSDQGRLWFVVPEPARRPLVLAVSRLGFAILDEHDTGAAGGGIRLVVARRDPFVVRGYRSGDEKAILDLFTPSFHVTRSPEHWRWKYLDNPWGRAMITIATAPNDELAAHYAGYPVPFVDARGDRRDELIGMQIGDTMTDARYRARGRGFSSLLGRCFRHHFAAYCEERVAFNFGFNTGAIRRFNFRFIGGELAELVGYWRRDVKLPAASRGLLRYRTDRVEAFDRRFDRLFHQAASFYGVLVRRSAEWLTWRYAQCPDDPPFFTIEARRVGQLVGYGVFRRRGEQLVWVDALFHPKHLDAAADVLRHALSVPHAEGTQEVIAWFSSQPVA